ncbi:MAG: LysM domain-containing protein [Methylocystis sp.]
MTSLPSHYPAAILIAALTAALLFHLSRILGRQRWVHAAFAAAGAGLIYLLGEGVFDWRFDGQGALLWAYLALFVIVGAIAARRRATLGAIGLPWLSALIQLGVVAYMFAPEPFRKPPVTAALFLYFLCEAAVWLRGREQEPTTPASDDDRKRPPLFPPPRRRGVAEGSVAIAAIAIAYLLAVGPHPVDVGPGAASAQQQEPQIEPAAAEGEAAPAEEQAANDAREEARTGESAANEPAEAGKLAAGESAAPPPSAAAKDPGVYAARAGDSFRSIAKRLYGSANKWRALADANPELKAKKFRAGQLIKLPSAPIP